jgi:hypothetical protein
MRADQIEWMKRKWNEVMECVDFDLVKHQETCLSLNRNYVILMLWFLHVIQKTNKCKSDENDLNNSQLSKYDDSIMAGTKSTETKTCFER